MDSSIISLSPSLSLLNPKPIIALRTADLASPAPEGITAVQLHAAHYRLAVLCSISLSDCSVGFPQAGDGGPQVLP